MIYRVSPTAKSCQTHGKCPGQLYYLLLKLLKSTKAISSREKKNPSQNAISKHMMNKWDPWEKSMQKSKNPRMLHQLTLHSQQIIKETSTQDLDPRSLANHDHPSILPYEMHAIESGETPSRILKWSPLGFLIHSNVVPAAIGSLFLFGRFGFDPLSVCQFRY